MSEIVATRRRTDYRWQLLGGASALVLCANIGATNTANADDADRPTIWIELGGQLERVDSGQETFAPPFILRTPRPPAETVSPLSMEHAPRYSKGGEAAFSFSPSDSDWSVSAAIRYGRSGGNNELHQQSYPGPFVDVFKGGGPLPIDPLAAKFSDITTRSSEQHFLLDFQAGKDVGLGMFGSSTINIGVRFAQFSRKSNFTLKSNPDWHFNYYYYSYTGVPYKFAYGQPYHSYVARFTASRSFHGIGPSLSWKASTPVVGHSSDREIAFDWGVNAALLFGRQKAQTHHQTTAQYHPHSGFFPGTRPVERTTLYQNPATPDHARSKSVIVPNIGAFAGLSFRYAAAKVSFGYRADLFFNAMDGGIDTARKENVGFYGPFASVSVGLGG